MFWKLYAYYCDEKFYPCIVLFWRCFYIIIPCLTGHLMIVTWQNMCLKWRSGFLYLVTSGPGTARNKGLNHAYKPERGGRCRWTIRATKPIMIYKFSVNLKILKFAMWHNFTHNFASNKNKAFHKIQLFSAARWCLIVDWYLISTCLYTWSNKIRN